MAKFMARFMPKQLLISSASSSWQGQQEMGPRRQTHQASCLESSVSPFQKHREKERLRGTRKEL